MYLRGLLLLILLFLINGANVFAYELFLPNQKKSVVQTNYAFFVGKARKDETIKINGEYIPIAINGAFAHSVPLKSGENRIMIKSNYNTQVYHFYKQTPTPFNQQNLTEFEEKFFTVKCDNTPLRNTPIDAGMNRIGHLFEGTSLIVNGEQGEFYRVVLSENDVAWIMKKDVIEDCRENYEPATYKKANIKKFKNAYIQTIEFDKNLPYTIETKEKELIFKVYNPEYSKNSIFTLNIPTPEKYSYDIKLENGLYTIKVSNLPVEIDDIIVTIDAGHGGSERGAIGCLGDKEKDINLKIANELQEILTKNGINTQMTRSCDGYISLKDRVDFAKQNNTNIFVSVHLNSIPDIEMNVHKNRGTSVYYYNPQSKELAQSVIKNVTKLAGTRNDGVRTASFAVIRPTNYLSILVECAYMTNPYDSVMYTKESFIKEVAQGIADGIIKYVNSEE